MMRSMMSAVTGLRAQQTAMDVEGNNIANVNTAGFRSSSTQFEDLFYQTLNGGSAETNPSQVGYGSQVSTISKDMTSSGATTTDNPWDLYIDGNGYFALSSTNGAGATPSYYTRVGNFTFDTNGYLVDSANGSYVMGTSDNGTTLSPLCLTGTNVYINGTKITSDVWKDLRDVTFNTDGSISASYNSKPGTIQTSSDGGTTFSNLKVALASFVNENGLSQIGNNDFEATESSGPASYYTALNSNTTQIRSDALEMSNVDMAKEFTDMIVTQRGFQANSRVITISDTMLDELINLKRS